MRRHAFLSHSMKVTFFSFLDFELFYTHYREYALRKCQLSRNSGLGCSKALHASPDISFWKTDNEACEAILPEIQEQLSPAGYV